MSQTAMIPRVVMHLEVETEDCICPRLDGCGGISATMLNCSEHGSDTRPLVCFHTHPLQVNKVNRGRRF